MATAHKASHSRKFAKLTKFENRVRFNWGFWDGVNDQKTGSRRIDRLTADTIVASHFDHEYAVGYMMGWNESNGVFGGACDTSEPAWQSAVRIGAVKAR